MKINSFSFIKNLIIFILVFLFNASIFAVESSSKEIENYNKKILLELKIQEEKDSNSFASKFERFNPKEKKVFIGIIFVILVAVPFGIIKYLNYFFKLSRKEKKSILLATPVFLVILFSLIYLISYFVFPDIWEVNIISVSFVFILFLLFIFVSTSFENLIFKKKNDPKVEKKESKNAYWEGLKEKVKKNFSSSYYKKSNIKSDTESRLEKLQELFDQNLISEEEYTEQRKRIIDDI